MSKNMWYIEEKDFQRHTGRMIIEKSGGASETIL